ncbi:MAG: TetR/AcrR family transcriptional regulator [Actinomycetota bacterium]|nr:TetR/AcrR family transcriptional regulator [Actinomycetota bacterium]
MARPSQPILSADKIAVAAIEAVDTGGQFTMPGIANALGVSPSSLYNHVSGKREIVEIVRARLIAEHPMHVDPDASWEESVVGVLRAYRASFAKHPRLIPILTSHTVAAPAVMEVYESLAMVLRDAGIPDTELLDAITLIDSFSIGSALDLAAPDEVWDSGNAAGPTLRAAIAAAPVGRARAEQSFEFGLEVLLIGLRKHGAGSGPV